MGERGRPDSDYISWAVRIRARRHSTSIDASDDECDSQSNNERRAGLEDRIGRIIYLEYPTLTMEDELIQIDDAAVMKEKDGAMADQILTLAFASAGCEAIDTDEGKTNCRLARIEPIENEIGKTDAMPPDRRLAEFFADNPGVSDQVLRRMQDLTNRAIDMAEVIAKEREVDQL